jgi:hypothetical protein
MKPWFSLFIPVRLHEFYFPSSHPGSSNLNPAMGNSLKYALASENGSAEPAVSPTEMSNAGVKIGGSPFALE